MRHKCGSGTIRTAQVERTLRSERGRFAAAFRDQVHGRSLLPAWIVSDATAAVPARNWTLDGSNTRRRDTLEAVNTYVLYPGSTTVREWMAFRNIGAKGFSCFTRLCPRCGKARVTVDGDAVEEVDTRSADDIWSAGAYAKTCTRPGKTQVRITVTGERGSTQSQGALVSMRGVRIE